MRIIFSRKGLDSASGGKPSPIVDGRAISLPIPATRNSRTSYGDLGLGEIVERITRNKLGRQNLCHADPWFADGQCAFGQTGAAQGHLANNGIAAGDVFLFFGLFADELTGEVHHRIYGFMRVIEIQMLGSHPDPSDAPVFAADHPHFLGERDRNNTVYLGHGSNNAVASRRLRLTQPDGPISTWSIPAWLKQGNLTYHGKEWRWPSPGTLHSVSRGQEFICDVGDDPIAMAWLDGIIAHIEGRVAEQSPTQSEFHAAEVIIAVLRQPDRSRSDEQRNDPFWEFGSFGLTGCHSKNLLHGREAHELIGKRIAFAQGGPAGFKLVYVTPPVAVTHHSDVCELTWPASAPLCYAHASTLIDHAGHTNFPALLDEVKNGRCASMVQQFSSNFRTRKQPVTEKLAAQLIEGFDEARRNGANAAKSYVDCLPYPPPTVDRRRRQTYEGLLAHASGRDLKQVKRKRC